MQRGVLYIVAGPIGNLKDITLRALDILKGVNVIFSEDTRETAKVLMHYQIDTPQFSYRDQNHERMLPQVIDFLESGKSLALVADSGTPLISDPGFKLVREIKAKGFDVIPVPGPSAVISALSVSGLPTDKFAFLGFLPKVTNQRAEILKNYGKLDCTLVIYESPYRIKKLLEEIYKTLGDRTVCLAGEMTKLHEKIHTEKLVDILKTFDKFTIKGEYVVLIGKDS